MVTEAASKTACSDPACAAGAWDLRETLSLSLGADLLGVAGFDDELMDAVPFRIASVTSDFSMAVEMLMDAQLDGQWLPDTCGGGDCNTSAEYDAIAVNWSGTGTVSTGMSMRRAWGVDTQLASDWTLGASSWGSVNP